MIVTDPGTISARAIESAPLLAVEVLSPSTERTDRTRKRDRYAANGIQHYWIVSIDDRSVVCLRLSGSEYVLVAEGHGETTLAHPDWTDLRIDLGALWR